MAPWPIIGRVSIPVSAQYTGTLLVWLRAVTFVIFAAIGDQHAVPAFHCLSPAFAQIAYLHAWALYETPVNTSRPLRTHALRSLTLTMQVIDLNAWAVFTPGIAPKPINQTLCTDSIASGRVLPLKQPLVIASVLCSTRIARVCGSPDPPALCKTVSW